MKRFILKFIILFVLVDGYLAWYAYKVYPNLCGELDVPGQIPFGPEYVTRMDTIYPFSSRYVQTIEYNEIEDTITHPLFTIGDSFSRQDTLGYQQFLGEIMDKTIYNINRQYSSPEGFFCQLVNSGRIPEGSTVIVESVERSLINRLLLLNIKDTIPNLPINKSSNQNGQIKTNLLNGAISKLRIMLGYKNPVVRFSTTEDFFTHSQYHNKLFIFNSKWDDNENGKDGDLLFLLDKEDSYAKAYDNLYEIKKLADSKKIKFIYLIVADKYDVYEPFIIENHPRNPTLDKCPDESWIVNTKPILQGKVRQGVKDVYRINDTHWSPIGAKMVAEELHKKISQL